MSTIKADNVATRDGSQSTSSLNVINGCAKAWVNFNGTGTVAIRAAYNVGSITDNGTGDYTVNFTTPMPDTKYCPVVSTSYNFGSNVMIPVLFSDLYGAEVAPSTTSFRVSVSNWDNADRDAKYFCVSVFR